MLPFLSQAQIAKGPLPAGYRRAGEQAIRADLAEKILRAAFDARAKADGKLFRISTALGVSIGLEEGNLIRLLQSAGFKLQRAPALADEIFGPGAPDRWNWRPRRQGGSKPHQSRGQRKSKGPKHAGGKAGTKRNDQGARQRQADHGPAKASGAFDALKDLIG